VIKNSNIIKAHKIDKKEKAPLVKTIRSQSNAAVKENKKPIIKPNNFCMIKLTNPLVDPLKNGFLNIPNASPMKDKKLDQLSKNLIFKIVEFYGISQLRSKNLLLNKKIIDSFIISKM
jgi:hypothetical protein